MSNGIVADNGSVPATIPFPSNLFSLTGQVSPRTTLNSPASPILAPEIGTDFTWIVNTLSQPLSWTSRSAVEAWLVQRGFVSAESAQYPELWLASAPVMLYTAKYQQVQVVVMQVLA